MSGTGYNATGGAIWWSRDRDHHAAIANERFTSVAAHLANRVARQDMREYYLGWARRSITQ